MTGVFEEGPTWPWLHPEGLEGPWEAHTPMMRHIHGTGGEEGYWIEPLVSWWEEWCGRSGVLEL